MFCPIGHCLVYTIRGEILSLISTPKKREIACYSSGLEEIAEGITWEDVPGTTIESCGNYKDHSLHSAKEWAKLILSQGISTDAFERNII